MCSPPFHEANSILLLCSSRHNSTKFNLAAMGSCQEGDPFEVSSGSFKKEVQAAYDAEEDQDSRFHVPVDEIAQRSRVGSSVTDISSSASINYRRTRRDEIGGVSFKCSVLCMYLPGLSKRRSMQQSMSLSEAAETRASMVSKVASMERFKCSSSSSDIIFECLDVEEEEEGSAYFDLPLELLRNSSVDTELPVTAAFVFDGNRGRDKKKNAQQPDTSSFSFPVPVASTSHPSSSEVLRVPDGSYARGPGGAQ